MKSGQLFKAPEDKYLDNLHNPRDILQLTEKMNETIYDLRNRYLPWTSYSATIRAKFDVQLYEASLMIKAIERYLKGLK